MRDKLQHKDFHGDNKPRVSHIQVFGCKTYAYGSNKKYKTLDSIGIVNIMVAYVPDDIGYRLLDTINFFNAIKCFSSLHLVR